MTAILSNLRDLDPETFQNLCCHILKERYPGANIEQIQGRSGDLGVDLFSGVLEKAPCIWQCKSFRQLGKSQKHQVRESLERALANFTPTTWILCIPIDLDVSERKWFEKLQREYASRVKIELFGGISIEHELVYRHSIREMFFPRTALSSSDIKSVLAKVGSFSTDELRTVSSEIVQQSMSRLVENDPRFTARFVFPHESTFTTKPVDEPGLLVSLTDARGRIDLFARDWEAIKRDPLQFTLEVRESAREKLVRNMETGSTEEILPEEIASARLPFENFFPQPVGIPTITVSSVEIKSKRRQYRVTIQLDDQSVVYNLMEFGVVRAGTKECVVASTDPGLPLKIEITLRKNAAPTFRCRQQYPGREIHAVQKASRAMNLIFQGADVEILDIELEKQVLTGGRERTILSHEKANFQRMIDELVEVSDRFGLELRIPQNPRENDLEHLQLLLSIARKGRITVDECEVSAKCMPTGDPIMSGLLHGELAMRTESERLNPMPQILGVNVDTGPVVAYLSKARLENLEETRRSLEAAAEGQAIHVNLKSAAPVELTFLKFYKETAQTGRE